MKISYAGFVLLTAGIWRGAGRVLYSPSVNANGESRMLEPLNNHNGWVNPEDLPSMPQCIAQQDQSAWLTTMTKCTSKRCTSHFGVICTHHQWLTQLSCLNIEFSPDIVKVYLSYCSRSVLATAQLYLWIRTVTDRTWLVDVGDANELQTLSPASLTKGYAASEVIHNAPTCLTHSDSASMEAFQHVLASCSFTSTTEHTGDAARPWEYNQALQSVTALDFETVGYELTGDSIIHGDYFDKKCFCGAYAIDPQREPCPVPGNIDMTRERLWMNATCGPTFLPGDWTNGLRITGLDYIPVEDWNWPKCVEDVPQQMIDLPAQCATDACELDSSGYCRVVRAVDRACFCRDVRYESCGGSCQIFETRIDYVTWLHDLCGNVRDWHGLPDNWSQLTTATRHDMIPWRWTLKHSNDSHLASVTRLGSMRATETCPSSGWKLGSFALVNIATVLAALLARRTGVLRNAHSCERPPNTHTQSWFSTGVSVAALQLLANWINAFLVQRTLGYEDVPVVQLMLLWCSMPRLTWLATLLLGGQPLEAMNFSAAASALVAETTLQILSSCYMIITVTYGREHNFYDEGMARLQNVTPAKLMYAGAFLWIVVVILTFAPMVVLLNQYWEWSEKEMTPYPIPKDESSTRIEGGNPTPYGTILIQRESDQVPQKAFVEKYTVSMIGMFLWIAQWLFWSGFIGLSMEEFCPPKLGVLTVVWIAFSLTGAIIGAVW